MKDRREDIMFIKMRKECRNTYGNRLSGAAARTGNLKKNRDKIN